MRLNAYYYGFDPTGVEAIDRVLWAVAGKMYHHTEGWNETFDYAIQGLPGTSCVDLIQNAANRAAKELMPSPTEKDVEN